MAIRAGPEGGVVDGPAAARPADTGDEAYPFVLHPCPDPDPFAEYHPENYLKSKTNLLRTDMTDGGIPFPTRVHVSNELSSTCTAIQIQALDRIGLLHDLFYAIGRLGLATVHSRICTEKGAAMDTLYVTWPDGSKVLDENKCREIEQVLGELVS